MRISARTLAVSAMLAALAAALHMLKLFHLPMGGSVTPFSMFFVSAIGWLFGPVVGAFGGLAFGGTQIIMDLYVVHPAQFLLDYIVAFVALGAVPGLVKNLYGGYAAAVLARYICHAVSGYIFFAEYAYEGWSVLLYTLAYNAMYIVPEAAATLLILAVPPVREALYAVKRRLSA